MKLEHLHNLHNDYPLAPEHVEIGIVEKLIPELNNKTMLESSEDKKM